MTQRPHLGVVSLFLLPVAFRRPEFRQELFPGRVQIALIHRLARRYAVESRRPTRTARSLEIPVSIQFL